MKIKVLKKQSVCFISSFSVAMEQAELEKQLAELMDWANGQIALGKVPRVSDVVEYAHRVRGFRRLSQKAISARLRLQPSYLMTSSQQRPRSRGRKSRLIHTNSLGHLHCDIAFYSTSTYYSTPVTFKSGFLVAKDVLSRYLYAVPLKKSKSAEALLAAFKEVLAQHQSFFGKDGHKIKSVSFDQERAVLSSTVQNFFKANDIKFHAFKFSASKAKVAEGAIRIIRNNLARLVAEKGDKRWWHNLPLVIDDLNSKEIIVDNKRLGFAPKEVNNKTLEAFLKVLHKKATKYYWAQFNVNPDLVKFEFPLEALVRPKLIVTSSAVLGVKRSEVTLEKEVFVVRDREARVTGGFHIAKTYKCEQVSNPGHFEFFDETDIALTTAEP